MTATAQAKIALDDRTSTVAADVILKVLNLLLLLIVFAPLFVLLLFQALQKGIIIASVLTKLLIKQVNPAQEWPNGKSEAFRKSSWTHERNKDAHVSADAV
jgi:F0F1-type ATP synthase assembly protein I